MSETKRVCTDCGAPVGGSYCAACGEKVLDASDLSLRAFAARGARTLTDTDAGLLPSLRMLLTRPGELTRAYLQGRRRRYLRPLRLFLTINLVYFLVQPLLPTNTYNTSLRSHMERQVYSELTGPVIERTLADRGAEFMIYQAAWKAKSEPLARALIIIMIPLFALCVAPLQRGRGVPAVGHLVFSLHFFAFSLLVGSIAMMALLYGLYEFTGFGALMGERQLILLTLALSSIYLALSIRRVYGRGRVASAVQGVLLAFLVFPVIFLYRFLLFWIVWLLV